MHAIISELDGEASEKVGKLWQILCRACGTKEIFNLPTPHLTWLSADEMDVSSVSSVINSQAKNISNFSLYVFGLGIFSGSNPVLYLPIAKSSKLIELHHDIYDQAIVYCKSPNKYYLPKFWIPHITIGLKDLNQENLSCAVNAIGFEKIELEITIDNLIIAEHVDEKIGRLLEQFAFSG